MTFLFLHGAYHGAWCWEQVIRELKKRGRKGLALDLPGAGEDKTPRAGVSAASCSAAVSDYINSENLAGVVLVAHSLAGILMPQVFIQNSDRIKNLVFLAALVLNAGERCIDLIPEERRSKYFDLAAGTPDNTIFWEFERAWKTWLPDFSEAEARQIYQRFTPQPFAVYLEESEVDLGTLSVPKEYLLCGKDTAVPEPLARACAAKVGVTPKVIDCGHEVMLSDPAFLAQVLCELCP